MIALDLEGFSVSSGTACSSGKLSEISLLKEMEYSEDLARCSIRVSLGPNTKKSDIEAFIFSWKQLYSRHKKHGIWTLMTDNYEVRDAIDEGNSFNS